MALGHVGGPALPLGVQVGHGVDGGYARAQRVVGAGQQFRPPRRHPGPGVQQRDVGLPAVERPVQSGQVSDLQGENDQPGRGGQEHHHRRSCARRHVETKREQRGAGRDEGRRRAVRLERPQQQREAQVDRAQPGDKLAQQDRGPLHGQQPVPAPEVVDAPDGHLEDAVDAPVGEPGQPAAYRPGHDQRSDHAGPDHQHQPTTGHRGDYAAPGRHDHGFSSGVLRGVERGAVVELSVPRPVRPGR